MVYKVFTPFEILGVVCMGGYVGFFKTKTLKSEFTRPI